MVNYKKYTKRTTKKRKKIKYKMHKKRKTRCRSRNKKGGNKFIPNTIEQLQNKLNQYNIDTSTWNAENRNKSVTQLLKEIKNNDSVIQEENGKIYRVVNVANAIITAKDGQYRLKEKAHLDISKNLTKERNNEVLSEKMDSSETVVHAIKRGVKEELGVKYSNSIQFIDGEQVNVRKVEKSSYSYPGLKSLYTFNEINVEIPLLTQDFPPPKDFVTEEENSDGSFKRYIVWSWVLNN